MLANGREAGQQIGVGPLHARAGVDQNVLLTVVDDVDVVGQRGERPHRESVDGPPGVGLKTL